MAKLKGGGQSGARWASAPAEGTVVGDAAQSRPARGLRHLLSRPSRPPPRPRWLPSPFRPPADMRGGAEGGRAEGVGRGRGGRTEEEREGSERAAAGSGACGVCAEAEWEGGRRGAARAGGGGMSARGASRGLLRPDGKSRAQPERSVKMAAASAVAAASGR